MKDEWKPVLLGFRTRPSTTRLPLTGSKRERLLLSCPLSAKSGRPTDKRQLRSPGHLSGLSHSLRQLDNIQHFRQLLVVRPHMILQRAALIFLAFATVAIAACASGSAIATGSTRAPIASEHVRIYLEPPADFEVIGLISASSDAGWTEQGSVDYAIDELKKQAKRGANGVLLVSSGDETTTVVGRQAHDSAVVVTPCKNVTSMNPRRLYLGDGITDHHYYPILDYLRANPGSESNTRALEEDERAAAQSQSPYDLKPPSASIRETEFSHLLGAIARDNGGIGAAVFDMTGLKVGAAGLQMEGLVLPADRLATLEKAPEDPPVEVRYTCNKLRELAKMFAKDCKGPITVYYRPVIDWRGRDRKLLGFSMLVVQNEPPCKDARQ